MKKILFTAVLIFTICFSLFPFCAPAVEIVVEPGIDTLNTAIDAAQAGDVLLLKDGLYQVTANYYDPGRAFRAYRFANNSLTIKSQSKAFQPLIGIYNQNPDKYVPIVSLDCVFQGITFLTPLSADRSSGGITLLQCRFSLSVNIGSLLSYSYQYGGGKFVLIGNYFQPPSTIAVATVSLSSRGYGEVIIAGNTFVNTSLSLSGGNDAVWAIGNQFDITADGIYSVINCDSNTYTHIAGNRISCINNWSYVKPISFGGQESLIAGNIIHMELPDTSTTSGIYGSGRATIANNIIHRTGLAAGDNDAAITNTGIGTIAGNIIVGHNYTTMIDAPYANVINNICNSNQGACGSQSGITVVDPQFEDLVDFRLAVGSPGIDAGPVDYAFSDLDRTRNDIGAYGGSWSIEQYDVQRDSNRTSPFVYPLIQSPLTAWQGQLPVRAIGVARLR